MTFVEAIYKEKETQKQIAALKKAIGYLHTEATRSVYTEARYALEDRVFLLEEWLIKLSGAQVDIVGVGRYAEPPVDQRKSVNPLSPEEHSNPHPCAYPPPGSVTLMNHNCTGPVGEGKDEK